MLGKYAEPAVRFSRESIFTEFHLHLCICLMFSFNSWWQMSMKAAAVNMCGTTHGCRRTHGVLCRGTNLCPSGYRTVSLHSI